MSQKQTSHRLKILRTKDLMEILGVSRVTVWRWERDGEIPRKRRLGPNTVGWLESEIEAWVDTKRPVSPEDLSVASLEAR